MVNPSADSTTEPESFHVSRSDQDDWFGHPRQLARLFTVEMWERFGYYGMRALLALYLANHFLFDDNTTNAVYGAFTSLAYLTPLVGGWIADRYLGSKRSVKLGALLMAVGYFTLCFGGQPAKPFATIEGQRYEVRLEGEHVVVTDLESLNGVRVLRPGAPARRLHPGEPTVVAPGETVDLGDGVTFTVDRDA